MCVSGCPLRHEQQKDLDRRLCGTDPDGLAAVDAACATFGILEPTILERQAALQLIWPLQVPPSASSLHHTCSQLQCLDQVAVLALLAA